jgi:hypothetical protein
MPPRQATPKTAAVPSLLTEAEPAQLPVQPEPAILFPLPAAL